MAGGEFCCKIKGEMEQKFLGNGKIAFRFCFYNKTRASLSGMDSLRGRVASLALISYGFVTFSVRAAAHLGFSRKCCSRTTFWTGFGKRKSRVIGKNPGALRGLGEIQRGDYALFLKVICNIPIIQKCHSVSMNLIVFSEMLL